MGTRCIITLYAESESDASQAASAAFQEIARIEGILTDYNPDSESMRVLQKEPNQWHRISPTLSDILNRSLEFYGISSGAFDPTLGACTHLWRRTTRSGRIPTTEERAQALAASGFDKLTLDPLNQRLKFSTRGMILDFGGIGKGYAADQALSVLYESGITRSMVDLGGDIAIGDPPPDDSKGWEVEIQTGIGERETKVLSRCAIATSGDLEQFFIYEGQRFSHILDPKTGLGLSHSIAVTVVADHATTADALASMISVMGESWESQVSDLPPDISVRVVVPRE